MMARTATPPIVPPTMAPVLELEWPFEGDVSAFGAALGVVEAATDVLDVLDEEDVDVLDDDVDVIPSARMR